MVSSFRPARRNSDRLGIPAELSKVLVSFRATRVHSGLFISGGFLLGSGIGGAAALAVLGGGFEAKSALLSGSNRRV